MKVSRIIFRPLRTRMSTNATVALLLITGGALSAAPKVDFARDVQPILHSRCSACHSGQKPQANLSVLTRRALLRAA